MVFWLWYDVHITKLKLHNERAKINKLLQKMLGVKKKREKEKKKRSTNISIGPYVEKKWK